MKVNEFESKLSYEFEEVLVLNLIDWNDHRECRDGRQKDEVAKALVTLLVVNASYTMKLASKRSKVIDYDD